MGESGAAFWVLEMTWTNISNRHLWITLCCLFSTWGDNRSRRIGAGPDVRHRSSTFSSSSLLSLHSYLLDELWLKEGFELNSIGICFLYVLSLGSLFWVLYFRFNINIKQATPLSHYYPDKESTGKVHCGIEGSTKCKIHNTFNHYFHFSITFWSCIALYCQELYK